jgi:hypothetical protein
MQIDKVIKQVQLFFQNNLGKTGDVIGAQKTDDGWTAEIEVIEDEEYLKRHARNGIIALYEVKLTADFEVFHYERKSLRERGKFEAIPDEIVVLNCFIRRQNCGVCR